MDDRLTRARLQPDTHERFVRLRAELGVRSFGLNQIVLQPGQRGRIHRHDRQEEVYLVLEGVLTLVVEAEEVDLGVGELVRVPSELRRQLVNRGPRRLSVLALGGDGDHQGRDGEAFEDWEATIGAPPQETPLPDDLPPEDRRT
jgi:mannose-6-phosphate isomerase-like protein (cupin superfamily)